MYKNFSSKFSVLCEEETTRFRNGGLLMGDYVKISPKALNHPKIKDRPASFIAKLGEYIKSEEPLKVSVVKSDKPATSNGLATASDVPDVLWADVVQELSPGLWVNPLTLPIDVLDVVTPDGNNWAPEQPDKWKYKNKEEKSKSLSDRNKKVAKEDDLLFKQTQGHKRNLPTKDTKIKESVDKEKSKTKLQFTTLHEMINSQDFEYFSSDKLGNNLFLSDPDRAERREKYAEDGADGNMHSEYIEDWREYLNHLKVIDVEDIDEDTDFSQYDITSNVRDSIEKEIDEIEEWHEKNGTLYKIIN